MGPLTIHNRCLYVKTLEILKDEHKILIPILFYYTFMFFLFFIMNPYCLLYIVIKLSI